MKITFRTAGESDRQLLFELYASTREAELALVPWTEPQKLAFVQMQFAAQAHSYAETHPHAVHEIIVCDGRDCGRLYLSRLPESFHILDITIAPASRSAGIGTRVLAEIVDEADRVGKPVSIYVEETNPSVRFFRRFGFEVARQDGFQLFLNRLPGAASHSQPEAAPEGD
jgi:ribosomal protein S18 acetylase RimI-like enzyme